MPSRYLAALALGISAMTLSACGEQASETEQVPDNLSGLAVENARLVLPAVGGNPAAVYFDITYSGEADTTLSAVAVEGAANTMMHQYGEKDLKVQMIPLDPVALTKGSSVTFEPGGKHIMAMGLSDELSAGGTTEVTLILANGDKATVDAAINAAGDAR